MAQGEFDDLAAMLAERWNAVKKKVVGPKLTRGEKAAASRLMRQAKAIAKEDKANLKQGNKAYAQRYKGMERAARAEEREAARFAKTLGEQEARRYAKEAAAIQRETNRATAKWGREHRNVGR